MTRRAITRFSIGFVLAVALASAAERRPNVVFIAVDDLNDWVGCLGGHPQVKTPHIDRLAARGTLFTNAHCQAPLCNPSRASLLTGLRPSTTGVYALQPWFRSIDKWRNWTTLPQYFREHGYRTLAAGKIYHGAWPPSEDRARDWDVFGPVAQVGARPAEKLVHTPQGDHPLVDWGAFPHRDEDKGDWQVASWAVEQIQSAHSEGDTHPFFLAAGFFLPHVPCYATPKWFDLYPAESLTLPPTKTGDRDDIPRFASFLHWRLPEPRLAWLVEHGQWRPLVQSYLACVSFVDSQVGRILTAIEKGRLAEHTVVVLWSDHGWHLGEKGITGKNSLWERSTRVPLIFAGPGVTAGARCSRPAELLDLYPTLIDLCGLPPRSGLEGHSLLPQLKDANAPREWPAITTHNQNNHSIRTERWRYIHHADNSEELYYHVDDPNEWANLAADPSRIAIKHDLARWLPTTNADPVPGSAERLLIYKNGAAIWEGKPIGPDEKMP